LRHRGAKRFFAWQAYVYHLKPPGWESFEAAVQRMGEKGRMARRFVQKTGDWRVRLATGDHPMNHLRGAVLGADWTMPLARSLAQNERMPRLVQSLARGHYLDGAYRAALRGCGEFDGSPVL
jgi:broad specificity phosphatase PhoE